jgi:hypothetical protein
MSSVAADQEAPANGLSSAQRDHLERVQWYSGAVGAVALLVCVIGGFFAPEQFFATYLVSYLFALAIAHGCILVLMIYFLTGGAWGFLVRRILEAGMRTLPLLALLFIPIGLGVGYLYIWAHPDQVKGLTALEHQRVYLNVPFFWGRAVLYFVLWIGIAYLLSWLSKRQNQTDDLQLAIDLAGRMTRVSAIGLIVFGISITFAAVDWVMSLQPAFRSTIFGPLFATGEILAGFSWSLLILSWLIGRSPLTRLVSVEALTDLGSLLFTFLIIWAYLVFFQFMLIWIANLPYDSLWLLTRGRGGWQVVAWFLFVFHFVVPFFCLLMRPIKRNPRRLAAVAGLLLFMQLVYLYYQVLPAFEEMRFWAHWMDFVAPFGVGGLWLANFVWDLKQGPVFPSHDPSQQGAVHFREMDMERQAREEELHHA